MSSSIEKKRKILINKLILVLILSGILLASYHLINLNSNKIKVAKEKIRSTTDGAKVTNDDKRVLDCAKKVAVNGDLLNGKSPTQSDCLFQGCGDFFQ